jgi:hypothetical protein
MDRPAFVKMTVIALLPGHRDYAPICGSDIDSRTAASNRFDADLRQTGPCATIYTVVTH